VFVVCGRNEDGALSRQDSDSVKAPRKRANIHPTAYPSSLGKQEEGSTIVEPETAHSLQNNHVGRGLIGDELLGSGNPTRLIRRAFKDGKNLPAAFLELQKK
jgi:hypothetical protein